MSLPIAANNRSSTSAETKMPGDEKPGNTGPRSSETVQWIGIAMLFGGLVLCFLAPQFSNRPLSLVCGILPPSGAVVWLVGYLRERRVTSSS